MGAEEEILDTSFEMKSGNGKLVVVLWWKIITQDSLVLQYEITNLTDLFDDGFIYKMLI